MDLSYSWLAIRGVGPQRVHETLGLAPTGVFASAPEEAGEIGGADLPGGWRLIFSRRFDYADHAPLEKLSVGGELITCCVNEPMMYSSVSRWRSGRRDWYFVHDGNIGIQHMHIEGEPPAAFHEIANRLNVVQAEGAGLAIEIDHIFEIAPQVAEALTGFRRDNADSESLRFERIDRK